MSFGKEADIVDQKHVNLLGEPVANIANNHEVAGAMVVTKPEGSAMVVNEAKLNPCKAYTLVLGHRRLRVNFVQILQKAQAFHGNLSQIQIFLCQMITLQVIQPALAKDIEKMKADFVHGYQRTALEPPFFISP